MLNVYTPTSYSPYPAPTSYYFGGTNEQGLRSGQGFTQWKKPQYFQSYEGQFLNGCLHGEGTYKWNYTESKCEHEGSFYANQKEGYALVSYPDGSTFEGLFKKNQRYGPGIFTQMDGQQDVGLWEGGRLTKLAIRLEETVSRLATSSQGKIKLLQYRRLIEINKDIPDIATELLNKLNASSQTLEKSNDLYSPLVRDPRSLHFNTQLYNKTFYGRRASKNLYIEVVIEEEEVQEMVPKSAQQSRKKSVADILRPSPAPVQKTRTVPVTHLIAWNNNQEMTDMLIHVFKNRNFEDTLTYNIKWLLACNRNIFRPAGQHEEACTKFLKNCNIGNESWVQETLNNHCLNPDVTDAYGNSGLIIAAGEDNHEIIEKLLDAGANVNHYNDEGFTALSLCLTHYLAVENNVTNWEQAFLLPETQTEIKTKETTVFSKEWHTRKSETSLLPDDISLKRSEVSKTTNTTKSILRGHSVVGSEIVKRQPYIFNLDPLPPPPPQTKGQKSKQNIPKEKTSKQNSKRVSILVIDELTVTAESEAEAIKIERLCLIEQTIINLLGRGANPDCCEVPHPPLILAMFSKNVDLVKELLNAGADPNKTTQPQDGGLTPLHIITLMPPCSEAVGMCKLLLEHGADPNIRTLWNDEKDKEFLTFEGQILPECGGGKTALHTLCMRPDGNQDKEKHLHAVAKLLVEEGNGDTDALYLGYSPLAMAIKRGNTELVEQLLQTNKVNPNLKLTDGLGVACAVLLSTRCAYNVPLEISKIMFDILIKYGADPLMHITLGDDFEGNLVDFMYHEIDTALQQKNKKAAPKQLTDKLKDYRKLLEYLTAAANTNIVRNIQGMKTKELLKATTSDILLPQTSTSTTELDTSWLSPKDVVRSIKIMSQIEQQAITRTNAARILQIFNQKKAVQKGQSYEDILEAALEGTLLEFLPPQEEKEVKSAVKEEMVGSKSPDEMTESNTVEVERKKSIHIEIPQSPFAVLPEIDQDTKKYAVCFECGRDPGTKLYYCPKCKLIYFCSKECNRANMKKKTLHTCNIFFYGDDSLYDEGKPQLDGEELEKEVEDETVLDDGLELSSVSKIMESSKDTLHQKQKRKEERRHKFEEELKVGEKKHGRKSMVKGKGRDEDDDTGRKKGKKKSVKDDEEDRKEKKGKLKEKGDDERDIQEKKKGEHEHTAKRGKKGKHVDEESKDERQTEQKKKKEKKKDKKKGSEDDDTKGKKEIKDKKKGSEDDDTKGKKEIKDKEKKSKYKDHMSESTADKSRRVGSRPTSAPQRLPKKYQELLLSTSGSANQGFDLDSLLLPYTVLRDENIYYRLYGPTPKFTENYSLN